VHGLPTFKNATVAAHSIAYPKESNTGFYLAKLSRSLGSNTGPSLLVALKLPVPLEKFPVPPKEFPAPLVGEFLPQPIEFARQLRRLNRWESRE
jgi:hypothetical protein